LSFTVLQFIGYRDKTWALITWKPQWNFHRISLAFWLFVPLNGSEAQKLCQHKHILKYWKKKNNWKQTCIHFRCQRNRDSWISAPTQREIHSERAINGGTAWREGWMSQLNVVCNLLSSWQYFNWKSQRKPQELKWQLVNDTFAGAWLSLTKHYEEQAI